MEPSILSRAQPLTVQAECLKPMLAGRSLFCTKQSVETHENRVLVARAWKKLTACMPSNRRCSISNGVAAPERSEYATSPEKLGRSGITASGGYFVSPEDKEMFHLLGFIHLPRVLTEEEMQQEIDDVYEQFINGKIPVPGKDLCDMSNVKGRSPDEFIVYNVMLPRTYYPQWQGNLFEKRCQEIADQLQGGDMVPDYDQILAKRPHSKDAVFAWHQALLDGVSCLELHGHRLPLETRDRKKWLLLQDMAYWPPFTAENATATCWLAVSNATIDNGCMRFVPCSHRETELRSHAPVSGSRKDSHALYTTLKPTDPQMYVPISRGDITVHNEQVIHGSGPNLSAEWRKAYVLAFRKAACVAEERSYGFDHSHNSEFNWDQWIKASDG